MRIFAVRLLRQAGFIGPLAAPAVPETHAVGGRCGEPASVLAVQAFGTIGQGASNAVEIMTQLATNSLYPGQLQAVEALGKRRRHGSFILSGSCIAFEQQ